MSLTSARASSRPVAFCLHALGASSAEFAHLREALAGELEVVALDLPGFGDTPWSDGPSVEETVEFVIRRIRARGAARWMLVGHSMGGKIASIIAAQTLAGRAPLFGLAGVVLLAASPVTPEPMDEDRRESMLDWASVDQLASDGHLSDESAREFVEANIAGPLAEADLAIAMAGVRRTDPLAWRAWLTRGSREDWSSEVGTLALPALIVSGAEDGDLGEPAQRRLNGATYPTARYVTIDEAAHLLPLERPREVGSAILAFWQDYASTAPEVPLSTGRIVASDRTSQRTRGILSRRAVADDPGYEPSVLSAEQLATLRALADALVPQGDGAIDLAARVDQQLARGGGDGWRNPALPADADAYRVGLDALAGFGGQAPGQQATTIEQLINGSFVAAASALTPEQLQLWFEDVRVDLARLWMAHPASYARVGFDGFGNGGDGVRKQGFTLLDAGSREAWEPTDADTGSRCRMNLHGMRVYDHADEVDVVVVGSGAGGAPLTASLASAGLSVVVLEAGANFEPGDHTPDETEAVDIIWMDERLSGGDTPTAFGPNNSGRGVGGSTLHWGAFTPRPDARDLSLRAETGQGADWPIPYAELVPHLARVEQYLGVSGPADYPWDPDRHYSLPPVPRNASSDMMIRGCEALGIRATDAPAAVASQDWQQEGWGLRQACVNCGACHQGCRNGAKVSMDTSYLPVAVSRGAEIRPESTVHTIETDDSGKVTAVVYRRDGVDYRQRCATLVLAAGGVETPRLLLHSALANSSGQVGCNFMAHGGVQVWGRFDQPMRSYRGYPSSIITEDLVRPADADFAGGYLVQSLGVMPLTFATTLIRGTSLWGPDLIAALESYPYLGGLGINGECFPSEANRLTLSDEVDELGVPKAHVTFSAGENERAIDAHAVATMSNIISAAGGRDLVVLPRSAHTLGTCRMGETADAAVVDAQGRSFDIPNLWICDNSVFPSSLTANPGLLTMALSLRTADAILAAR